MGDINKLYDNIKQLAGGKIEVGTVEQFTKALGNQDTAKKIYGNLSTVLTKDQIGSENDFLSFVNTIPMARPQEKNYAITPEIKMDKPVATQKPLSPKEANQVIYGQMPGTTKIGDVSILPIGKDYQQKASKIEQPEAITPTNSVNSDLKPLKIETIVDQPEQNGEYMDILGSKPQETGIMSTGVGDAVERFEAGAIDMFGNTFGAINNFPSMVLGLPTPEKTEVQIAANEVAEYVRRKADRYKGKDFKQLWKDGDKLGAAGDIALAGAESLPGSLLAMFGGGAGLLTTGASAMTQQYDKLRNNKTMSEDSKRINSMLNGTIQVASEFLGDVPIGNMLKGIATRTSAKAVGEAIGQGLKGWIGQSIKKAGLLFPPVGEGLEEIAAQVGTNVTDYITGARKDWNPFDGAFEAGVYGMGAGAGFSVAGGGMQVAQNVQSKKEFKQADTSMTAMLSRNGYTKQEAEEIKQSLLTAKPEDRNKIVVAISGVMPDAIKQVDGKTQFNPEISNVFTNFFVSADNLQATSSKFDKQVQSETLSQEQQSQSIVQQQKDEAAQQLVDLSNKTTGTIQTVKLKDNSEIQIANGTPIFKEDGTFDAEKTGIITHNPKDENGNPVLNEDGTPKILVVDPNSIMSLVSETPVQEAQAEAGSQIDQAVISNQIDNFYPKDVEDYNTEDGIWRISVDPTTSSLTKQKIEVNENAKDEQGRPIVYEIDDPINITDEEYSQMSGKPIPTSEVSENQNERPQATISDQSVISTEPIVSTEPAPTYPTDKNGNVDFKSMTDQQIFNHTRETKGEEAAHSLIGRQIIRLQGQIQDNTRATNKHNEETNKLLAKAKTMQDEVTIQAKQDAKEVSLKEEYTALNSKLGELQSFLPKVEAPARVETPKVVTTRPEILQLQKEQAQANLDSPETLTPNLATSTEVLQPNVDTSNEVQEKPVIEQSSVPKPKETPFQKRAKELGEYIDMKDYILRIIAGGQKIKWKGGLESEFRGSNAERLQRRNYIDETNGLTPTELAHQIWNDYGENGNNGEIPGVYNMSDGEILDEVHEVLRTVKSNSDALSQAEERRTIGTYDPTPEEAQIIDAFDDEMFAAVLGITNFTPEQLTTLNDFISGWSEYIQYEQNSINTGTTPTSESNSTEGNASSEEGSRTEEVSKEEQFNLTPAENFEQFETNINWFLKNYGSREMAAIQVELYLNEKPEFGKEYIAKHGITTTDELKVYLGKLQAKLRAGKGNERKAVRSEIAKEKTERNVDEVIKLALEAEAEMQEAIRQSDLKGNSTEQKGTKENSSVLSPIKNGSIVTFKGKQYTVNGITSDGKFVDLYEGDKMIHEDIHVESVSNLETLQQSNEAKLSETSNEQPDNQKNAKIETTEEVKPEVKNEIPVSEDVVYDKEINGIKFVILAREKNKITIGANGKEYTVGKFGVVAANRPTGGYDLFDKLTGSMSGDADFVAELSKMLNIQTKIDSKMDVVYDWSEAKPTKPTPEPTKPKETVKEEKHTSPELDLVTVSTEQKSTKLLDTLTGGEFSKTKSLSLVPESFTVQSFNDFEKQFNNGEITLDAYKKAFEVLRNSKDAIIEELGNKKKDELINSLSSWSRYASKNEKKDRIVKAIYDDMLMTFTFGSIEYDFSTPQDVMIGRKVEKATQKDIDNHVEEIQKQRAIYKQRLEEHKKALTNPETLPEFRTFIDNKGMNGLSIEQKAAYDNLITDKTIEKRDKLNETKSEVSKVELGDAKMSDIIETKHTKTGDPLFVIKLSDRVEKEVYHDLNSKAKKLGGGYSSYSRDGAVPGFQFKSREQAEKFISLQNENVSAAPEAAKEDKIQERSSKLRDNAQKMIDASDVELNRERLTNTNKRASEASRMDERANGQKRIGQTMLNIANAIDNGDVKLLGGINAKTHIELLDGLIQQAQYKELNEKYSEYSERQKHQGEPATLETIEHLRGGYYPSLYVSRLKDLIKESLDKPGVKRIATKWEKSLAKFSESENVRLTSDAAVQEIQDMLDVSNEKYFFDPIKNSLADHKRLKAMGIENDSMLRAALREYIQYRGVKGEIDKVKQLERNLVGKNVGIDFFPTPKPVVNEMLDYADIQEGMSVLEPSAGNGNIADAVKEQGYNIDVIEISNPLREVLEAKGYNLVGTDFMEFDEKYDRIIMNPPFGTSADIDHVLHAYDLLNQEGKLVAVMSESTFFRNDSKSKQFREFLDNNGAEVVDVEAGAFNDRTLLNTTGVKTRIVVIDKNEAKFQTKKPLTESTPEEVSQLTERLLSTGLAKEVKMVTSEEMTAVLEGNEQLHAVYHGSPHSFDQFSLAHIGTGEGAQAYGHGLYFTDKKEIAQDYAKMADKHNANKLYDIAIANGFDNLRKYYSELEGIGYSVRMNDGDLKKAIENMYADYEKMTEPQKKYADGFIEAFKPFVEKVGLKNLQKEIAAQRNLYSVELHEGKQPGEYDYLRWEKPVSSEIKEKIFKQLRDENVRLHDMGSIKKFWDGESSDFESGDNMYGLLSNLLGSQKEASEFLLRAGIDGIQYPANHTTGKANETDFNYVVFDPSAITIKEKVQFMRKPDGTIYGFVKDGVVYLNSEKPNLNTPIHEFGHLFIPIIKSEHPEFYQKGVELIKESPYYDQVKNDPNYSNLDEDGIIDEAMNQAIGDKGEKVVEKGLFEHLKEWIKGVWERIGAKFGIKNLTSEQIEKLTLSDWTDVVNSELLNGKKLSNTKNSIFAEKTLKEKQLDIINESNPMLDDYHTGIRSVADIKTLEEAISDPEWDYDEYNPDYTKSMAQKAIKTGKVTVYSSNPIKQGVFVSPSKMEAESYSGNGKVYAKEVNTSDVAWIDPTQGQYASISTDVRYQILGEKGAEMLDISASSMTDSEGSVTTEATTRLDNLKVAKEMEEGKSKQELPKVINEKNELKSLLDDAQIKNTLKFSHIYGSQYWSINGKEYRVSDHSKKEGSNFELGLNDFRSVQDLYDYLKTKTELDLSDKTETEKTYREQAKKHITTREDGLFVTPTGVLFDNIDNATNNMWRTKVEIPIKYKQYTPSEIRLATGWEKGVDGLWRYEVADGKFKKEWEDGATLEEVWEDEELFKAYPQLKDIQIGALSNEESENAGSFHPKGVDDKPTIYAGGKDVYGLKSIVIHEIQHAIQDIEGFASGGSLLTGRTQAVKYLSKRLDELDDKQISGESLTESELEEYTSINNKYQKASEGKYDHAYYKRLAGETESRNAARRMFFTSEERRSTLLSETADVAPEDQVIIYDSLGISESSLKPQPPVFTSADTILDQARKMRDHEEALQRWQERQIVNLATQNGDRLSPATISKLNKDINSVTSKLWEGWADAALPIKEFQKFLEKNGVPISDNDNYYMRLTTVPSRIEYRFNQFKEDIMKPFIATLKAIEKNGFTYDDITTYAKLKHGPEYTANILVREYTNKIEAERAKIEDVTGSKDWTTKNQKLDQKLIDFKSTIFDYIEQQGIDYAGRDSIEKRIGETADNFITNFESENGSLVDDFWKQSKEVSHYALDEEVRGGMRTKESAEAIKGMFDYYVPLKGHREPTAETTWDYSMEHGDFFFSAVKKGKGRTSESDDPFSVMESTVRSAIGAAEQNLQLQSLRRLALKDTTGSMTVSKTWFVKVGEDENGNPEFKVADEVPFEDTDTNETYNDKVAKFEEKMKDLKSKGEAYQGGSERLKLGLWIKPTNEREHEVVVKSNGESYTIRFHTSPRVAQAINGTNMRYWGDNFAGKLMSDVISPATRAMAGYKTLWRPAFILITNPLRDIHAGLNLAFIDEGAKFTGNVILNFRHAQAALLRRSLNQHWDKNDAGKRFISGKYDKMLNDYMMLGGKTGISKIMELKEIKKSIESQMKNGINPVTKVFNLYKAISDITENQMRVAVYITAIEKGYSSLKATSMAKEATVNFDRKGNGRNGLRELKATTAFVNVGFQAIDNIYSKSTKNTETKKRALLAIAANVLSGSLLVAAINTAMCALFGWDEDKWAEDFAKLSSFERNSNFLIWTPWGKIKIPLGQEFRMYHGLGMDLMMMAHGKVSGTETAINMIKGLSSLLPYNPIESMVTRGTTNPISALVGTADFLNPLSELSENKNWLGYSIYKLNQDEAAPGYTKIKTNKKGESYAPELIVRLSKSLDSMTGGDGAKAGLISPNPDIVDHLLGGYFSGIYEQPLALAQGLLSEKEGSFIKELTPRAIWMEDSEIQSRDTGLNEKYYDAKDEAVKADKLVGRYEKAIELLDKNNPDYETLKEKYQSKIDKLQTDELYNIQGTQKTISALEKSLDEISPKEQVKTEKEISELKKNIVKINNGEKVDPKNYTEYISEYYGIVKKIEEYKAKRVLGGEKDAELEKLSGKFHPVTRKIKSIPTLINLLEKDTKKNPSNREKNEAQIITLIKKL